MANPLLDGICMLGKSALGGGLPTERLWVGGKRDVNWQTTAEKVSSLKKKFTLPNS